MGHEPTDQKQLNIFDRFSSLWSWVLQGQHAVERSDYNWLIKAHFPHRSCVYVFFVSVQKLRF